MNRALVSGLLLLTLAGCSSSSGGAGGGPSITQKGTMVDYSPCSVFKPVAGATITIGSSTATSAMDGTYSIQVPQSSPFTMKVTAPGYIPLTEATDTATESYDRGNTLLISNETATFLENALPKFSMTGSLLTIELVKTGSCTDVTGTTVTVSGANADAVTQYPAQCASPIGGTSATDGTFPVASIAAVYNLTPGLHKVSVTSPKCAQVPYPYTDPKTGLIYDGDITTVAGQANHFTRVFLK